MSAAGSPASAAARPPAGPLDGVRILDLSSVIVGPFATQLLADMGADVIKVEAPSGDIMRHVPPMKSDAMGHLFLHMNRNKRSVLLDLKTSEGVQAVLRLAQRCDVVAFNMRPKAMEALGLGYEAIRRVKHDVIYAGVVGYDQAGPSADLPAYDDLIQGAAGIPSLMRKAGGGEPRYTPLTLADRAVALHFGLAIAASLVYRERTGKGQQILIPMFETMAQFVLSDHLGGLSFEPEQGPATYARLLSPDRRPYRTQDGHVCALVYNDKQWQAFTRLVNRADLAADTRFATQKARALHIDAFYRQVSALFASKPTAFWLERLRAADIPVAPLNTPETLLDDPQLAAAGFFEEADHPSEGRLRLMRPTMRWSEGALAIRRLPPRLGDDSVAVLAEAGYTADQIEQLVDKGVTRRYPSDDHRAG